MNPIAEFHTSKEKTHIISSKNDDKQKRIPLQRDKNRVSLIIVNQLSVISYVRQQQPQQMKKE